MSGLTFAGSSQFTAVSLWSSPPQVMMIAAMVFLVNSRHILMSAAIAPYVKHVKKYKLLPALFLMCDESWALAMADAKKRKEKSLSFAFYMGNAIALYFTWVLSTGLGNILGTKLGDMTPYGLDMAVAALFLVLLKGLWKGLSASFPWVISLLVAGITYKLVPGPWYVAAGALSCLVSVILFAKPEKEDSNTSLESSGVSNNG